MPFKKLYIITPPYFNPRSPRGGATYGLWATPHGTAFQSTLPTRGSDFGSCHLFFLRENFNPRSPRGGATLETIKEIIKPKISIHAPHEGERQMLPRTSDYCPQISIHAPHEGERQNPCSCNLHGTKVSIHAPHEGERQRKSAFVCSISANLLNIIHCGAVTRAVSRRRIALFRLFSVRRSGVFMYAYASH